MEETFAAILVALTALAGGFVIGDFVAKNEITTDCQKLGKFRHKDKVYECKEEK